MGGFQTSSKNLKLMLKQNKISYSKIDIYINTCLLLLQKLVVHTKSDIYVIIITGITEARRGY